MKTRTALIGLSTLLIFTALASSVNTNYLKAQELKIKEIKRKRGIQKIQLALLLDTSSSMNGLIYQAKNQLWEMVSHLSKEEPDAEIEIAIYQYGNSGLSVYSNYIEQISPFSSNLDRVSSELFKLSTNGGEEYCGAVIEKATEDLEWDRALTTQRVLVIAGNEPFNQGKIDYRESIAQSRKLDIQVNTIFCGSKSEGRRTKWEKGAVLGCGMYFNIDHNDRVQQIPTPFDDQIIICNKKLNSNYIPILKNQEVLKQEIVLNDNLQEAESKERFVEKALFKKSKVYSNSKSSWDAVDNYSKDKVSFEKHIEKNKNNLSKEFAGLTPKQVSEKVEKMKAERDQLNKELIDLESKRKKYISENSKSSKENTLGKQLVKAILN